MTRVLVTGSAGAIGGPVCAELRRRGHGVRGFDRHNTEGIADTVVGELEDRDAVRTAMRGVKRVVHLAAVPDEADFPHLVGPNVLGLFHVLDAARHEGAGRVILASSIQVLGDWRDTQRERPARAVDHSPCNHYGLTKLWAEQMGEMYARCYAMSVVAARVAFMVRNAPEAARLEQEGQHSLYLSQADVARFFVAAVEATNSGFSILYVVGKGGERLFDMQPARSAIGFEAKDSWPQGLGFRPASG